MRVASLIKHICVMLIWIVIHDLDFISQIVIFRLGLIFLVLIQATSIIHAFQILRALITLRIDLVVSSLIIFRLLVRLDPCLYRLLCHLWWVMLLGILTVGYGLYD